MPGRRKKSRKRRVGKISPHRKAQRETLIKELRQHADEQYEILDHLIQEKHKTCSPYVFIKLTTIQQFFLLIGLNDIDPLKVKTWKILARKRKVHYRTVGRWIQSWIMSQSFGDNRGKHNSHPHPLTDADKRDEFNSFVRYCIKKRTGPQTPQFFVWRAHRFVNEWEYSGIL